MHFYCMSVCHWISVYVYEWYSKYRFLRLDIEYVCGVCVIEGITFTYKWYESPNNSCIGFKNLLISLFLSLSLTLALSVLLSFALTLSLSLHRYILYACFSIPLYTGKHTRTHTLIEFVCLSRSFSFPLSAFFSCLVLLATQHRIVDRSLLPFIRSWCYGSLSKPVFRCCDQDNQQVIYICFHLVCIRLRKTRRREK